jgi:hypothetical protein
MKKKIQRLALGKRTIANLSAGEMSQHMGGNRTKGKKCGGSAVTGSSGWITCKDNG